ncbi:hypothetical protein L204_102937 [Cryptococcus depauperatus]
MDGTLTNSILTLSLCGLVMLVLVANYVRRGFEATMTDSSTSQNRRETSLDALLLSRDRRRRYPSIHPFASHFYNYEKFYFPILSANDNLLPPPAPSRQPSLMDTASKKGLYLLFLFASCRNTPFSQTYIPQGATYRSS